MLCSRSGRPVPFAPYLTRYGRAKWIGRSRSVCSDALANLQFVILVHVHHAHEPVQRFVSLAPSSPSRFVRVVRLVLAGQRPVEVVGPLHLDAHLVEPGPKRVEVNRAVPHLLDEAPDVQEVRRRLYLLGEGLGLERLEVRKREVHAPRLRRVAQRVAHLEGERGAHLGHKVREAICVEPVHVVARRPVLRTRLRDKVAHQQDPKRQPRPLAGPRRIGLRELGAVGVRGDAESRILRFWLVGCG